MNISDIDWSSLEFIGAGCNGVVYGNAEYVVKIGSISRLDVSMLERGAAVKVSPPVLVYYASGSGIPEEIKSRMMEVLGAVHTNVLISARAIPYFTLLEGQVSVEELRAAYVVAEALQEHILKKHDLYWADAHPWNLGYYEGNLVVLDW